MTEPATAAIVTAAHDRRVRIAFAALLCGAVAIAFAPIFVRLSEVGPTATAFWRTTLAAPVLWLWLLAPRRAVGAEVAALGTGRSAGLPRRPADFVLLAIPGLFFAGDLAFWHWSIRYTSVANATLLANFAPIFVTLASWLLFGARFSRLFLAGLALALGGATVLMSASLQLSVDNLLGDALGIVTALFYAGYILSIGRLRARFTTAAIMAYSTVVTALVLLPVTLASGEALIAPTLYGWAVLAGLAWLSHAGGQSLIAYALAHLPAAFSSLSLLLQPVTAALLAWVLLGEALGPVQGVGGAVVLAGILLARRAALTPAAVSPRPG